MTDTRLPLAQTNTLRQLRYVGNEDPGEATLEAFYKCFRGDLAAFDPAFVQLVATNFRAASAAHKGRANLPPGHTSAYDAPPAS
jgi:hypothetical protein